MENIEYETLILDQNNKVCYIDNEEILLTKKEYELLKFFLLNPNFIYSREELIEKLWDNPVTTRTVDTNVMRLRNKLKSYRDNLITRLGFGYGFKTK